MCRNVYATIKVLSLGVCDPASLGELIYLHLCNAVDKKKRAHAQAALMQQRTVAFPHDKPSMSLQLVTLHVFLPTCHISKHAILQLSASATHCTWQALGKPKCLPWILAPRKATDVWRLAWCNWWHHLHQLLAAKHLYAWLDNLC